MSKHMRQEERKVKRPRRKFWIATVSFLAIASMAAAAFLSMKNTPTQTFTTQTVGEVNIGDAETTPLFTQTNFTLGDSTSRCIIYDVGEGSNGTLKLYAEPTAMGDLADDMTIRITKIDKVGTPGLTSGCSNGTTSSQRETLVSTQPVSSLPTDYASGITLPKDNQNVEFVLTLPSDATDASGNTMDLGFVFHNE